MWAMCTILGVLGFITRDFVEQAVESIVVCVWLVSSIAIDQMPCFK